MFYTKDELKSTLRKLGLRSGMNVLLDVNVNLDCLVGEERTLLDAIKEIVGYDATILIPSFNLSHVNYFSQNIFVDYDQMINIDYATNAFHVKKTLPYSNVAKQLMLYDDILRSNHPTYSFIGWGKYAQTITAHHPLHFGLGNDSPIDKLFELGAVYLSINSIGSVYFDYIHSKCNSLPVKVNHVKVIEKALTNDKYLLEYEFNHDKYDEIRQTLLNEELAKEINLGDLSIFVCSMMKTYPLVEFLLGKK